MVATVQTMIDAGALRQLCLYHAKQNGQDESWELTTKYAEREFRDIAPETLSGLLTACKQSADMARLHMLNNTDNPDYIPA